MRYVLERLAAHPTTMGGQPEEFDLEAAVAAQIQRIVCARPTDAPGGQGTPLFEFGMPNIVEFAQGGKSRLEQYAARLKRMIARYEPRLRNPHVAIEPVRDGKGMTPFRLVVTGTLSPDRDAYTVRFDLSDY